MKLTLAGLLFVVLLGSACTIRFSQALTGSIPLEEGTEVSSSDRGFAFLGIVFSEPRPAHEQIRDLLVPCEKLTRVEVDYRELWFVLFALPRVTVTGDCVL